MVVLYYKGLALMEKYTGAHDGQGQPSDLHFTPSLHCKKKEASNRRDWRRQKSVRKEEELKNKP